MILVRQEIGEVLRELRQQKGRTLRQVASRASVALGYLSEVERGQKEAFAGTPQELAAQFRHGSAVTVPDRDHMSAVGDRRSRGAVADFFRR